MTASFKNETGAFTARGVHGCASGPLWPGTRDTKKIVLFSNCLKCSLELERTRVVFFFTTKNKFSVPILYCCRRSRRQHMIFIPYRASSYEHDALNHGRKVKYCEHRESSQASLRPVRAAAIEARYLPRNEQRNRNNCLRATFALLAPLYTDRTQCTRFY